MINEKLVKKFLVFMYFKHIDFYGESISNLEDSGLLLMGKDFFEKNPDVIVGLSDNAIQELTYDLAKELEARGLAVKDDLFVYLTEDGLDKAKRFLNPVRFFLKNYWKWYIPLIVSIILALLAIVRLINCP